MDEEKRTLTTEYSNIVVDTNTPKEGPPVIPQYAIDIMSKFFLKRMREDYEKNHTINL